MRKRKGRKEKKRKESGQDWKRLINQTIRQACSQFHGVLQQSKTMVDREIDREEKGCTKFAFLELSHHALHDSITWPTSS